MFDDTLLHLLPIISLKMESFFLLCGHQNNARFHLRLKRDKMYLVMYMIYNEPLLAI